MTANFETFKNYLETHYSSMEKDGIIYYRENYKIVASRENDLIVMYFSDNRMILKGSKIVSVAIAKDFHLLEKNNSADEKYLLRVADVMAIYNDITKFLTFKNHKNQLLYILHSWDSSSYNLDTVGEVASETHFILNYDDIHLFISGNKWEFDKANLTYLILSEKDLGDKKYLGPNYAYAYMRKHCSWHYKQNDTDTIAKIESLQLKNYHSLAPLKVLSSDELKAEQDRKQAEQARKQAELDRKRAEEFANSEEGKSIKKIADIIIAQAIKEFMEATNDFCKKIAVAEEAQKKLEETTNKLFNSPEDSELLAEAKKAWSTAKDALLESASIADVKKNSASWLSKVSLLSIQKFIESDYELDKFVAKQQENTNATSYNPIWLADNILQQYNSAMEQYNNASEANILKKASEAKLMEKDPENKSIFLKFKKACKNLFK